MSLHSSAAGTAISAASWQAIDDLLDELAREAGGELSVASYQRLVLQRLMSPLEASYAAFWSSVKPGAARIDCQKQAGVPSSENSAQWLAGRHAAVVAAIAAGEPRATELPLERQSATGEEASGHQLVHPLRGSALPAAIELVFPGQLSADRVRTLVGILEAVAELVADFHRRRELRGLRDASNQWRLYDDFAHHVHQSLDLQATAAALANEARRVVGCDRASVLIARGKSLRAIAVSGVDTINRRSSLIGALEKLAARVAACGEPVWYHDGVADLPDEILAPLDAYLEQSQARVVALLPLFKHVPAASPPAQPAVIGVLVAEHFQGTSAGDELRGRVAALQGHASLALNNALVHEHMPLARLSRALGRIGTLTEARQLPKTISALLLALAAVAALVIVPADFNVEAKGELQPIDRREVFASDDGVVGELLIDGNRPVTAGQPLLVLRKTELDLESQRVLGELQTAEKKLASVRAERLQDAPAAGDRRRDPHQLAAEEEELKAAIAGLSAQQKLVDQQREALTIRSPLAGQALTWNLDQLLSARPVQRGQALLTVADLDGPWQLELHLPDDRAGYLLAAQQALQPDLQVTFSLVSDPGRSYQGRVTYVAPTTELDAQQQSSVRVNVAFDRAGVPALRPGATAIAKIHCGRRSLGFVWLGDLINYARSLWW